jgi:hypothetical protein
MNMEPTYFLYSGKLFHGAAIASLASRPKRGEDATPEPSPPPRRGEDTAAPAHQPRRGEDPGPSGPEGEPVGDDEEQLASSEPVPGPGAPMVPEHGAPDANPIDPRVF